jgi:HNH endonuclease
VIFWIGITDTDWFNHLASECPVEVNFWQPSGRTAFRALQPGGLFLFKLHSPLNFIVGGGWFVRHSALPASVAWKAFETRNGVRGFSELVARVHEYAPNNLSPDPVVGCSILERPFFWPRPLWVDVSSRWAPNIVRGRRYDTTLADGAALWAEVRTRLEGSPEERTYVPNLRDLENEGPRWSQEFLTRARLGQGSFRVLVTEAYGRRCAMTGERTLPVLDAAHIRPYSESGPHRLSNGLLLRSDVHTLFDLGYITVTPDYKIKVSKRIRAEFANGRDYYALDRKTLPILPESSEDRPSIDFLQWHNESRFRP